MGILEILLLGIGLAMDAFAVSICKGLSMKNLLLAVSIIGIITFIISIFGVKIGNKFGDKYQSKAELMGGIILVLLGIKTLLEHLGIY